MSRADVLAEVGWDWQGRPAPGGPVRYFEAADIPAQLVLDERDIVVEVRPWSSICKTVSGNRAHRPEWVLAV